jgi:uncharacterized protein
MTSRAPVAVPDSEAWKVVSPTGGDYRIMISFPRERPPAGGYPAIFLLDANATFGTVTEAIRLRARRPDVTGVVPAVIVGIGYPTREPYDRRRRTYDFTAAPAAEPALTASGQESGLEFGGADAFLELLEAHVRPRVEDAFPIDASRLALFGHSLGGYFVLRTLLRSPASFASYVAASPAIWWDRRGLLASVESFGAHAAPAPSPLRVMLTAGEYEESLSPGEVAAGGAEKVATRRAARGMVSNARELAGRFVEAAGDRATVRFEEFAGEDHASTVLRTINRFLRFVLDDRSG